MSTNSGQITLNEQLVQACLDLNLPNIERLLNEGANPNFLTMRDEYNDGTYLKAALDIIALRSGFGSNSDVISAAKLLLDHGAIVHGGTSGEDFVSPLHWAADFNNFSLTELLINHGADVNTHDNDLGFTPLHNACGGFGGFASLELIEFLIQHGADVNAQSDAGKTAANLMTRWPENEYTDPKIIPRLELLAKYNADFSIVDAEQSSALSLMQNRTYLKTAVMNGILKNELNENNELIQKIIALLPEFGLTNLKELDNPEHKWAGIAILDEIIEAHLISIYPEHLLEHKLIQATIDFDIYKMNRLLEEGADPNFISPRSSHSHKNLSALHFLASDIYSSNNEKMIAGMEILLEHGANPNILSGQGDTPMHFLAKVPSNSYISGILQQAFDLFFKHGADINIANNDGETPASYLTDYNNKDTSLAFEQVEHQLISPVTNNASEVLKPLNDTSLIKPENKSCLVLEDIIQHDEKNTVFLESNIQNLETIITEEATPCPPYEGYVPLFIMQWLNLEKPCDANGAIS